MPEGWEIDPPDPLPHWQSLFMGFGVLSLANQAEMNQKLERPISQFDRMQREGVLTFRH